MKNKIPIIIMLVAGSIAIGTRRAPLKAPSQEVITLNGYKYTA